MPIATPALDLLSHALPDELKDIRLNLSSVLGGENLQSEQALGIALSAAHFLKSNGYRRRSIPTSWLASAIEPRPLSPTQ